MVATPLVSLREEKERVTILDLLRNPETRARAARKYAKRIDESRELTFLAMLLGLRPLQLEMFRDFSLVKKFPREVLAFLDRLETELDLEFDELPRYEDEEWELVIRSVYNKAKRIPDSTNTTLEYLKRGDLYRAAYYLGFKTVQWKRVEPVLIDELSRKVSSYQKPVKALSQFADVMCALFEIGKFDTVWDKVDDEVRKVFVTVVDDYRRIRDKLSLLQREKIKRFKVFHSCSSRER